MSDVRPGLIMCVCTGKCPGFEKMDIWDFINRVRIELPVEFGMIHPQLCEEDGDRFLADLLQAKRPLVIAACAPNMQNKLFRDAFVAAGHGREEGHGPARHPRNDHRRSLREGGGGASGDGRERGWGRRMAESTFMGVPRSMIPWAPTIDYDTCDFCMECDDFCPHRVFERREGDVKLVVANPNNCVVFCRACAKTCGPDAISFPDKPADRGPHQEAPCGGG